MADIKYRKSRDRAKRKYYAQTQFRGRHGSYTEEEKTMILDKSMSDRNLADLLNVSVKAIHNKRSRMKQVMKYGAEIW